MNEKKNFNDGQAESKPIERYTYHSDGASNEIHAQICTCQKCFNLVFLPKETSPRDEPPQETECPINDSELVEASTAQIDFLADSFEDVETELESRRAKTSDDYQVCFCGHSSRVHHYMAELDRHFCDFAKSGCPCSKFQPAYVVQDLRFFMCKTTGSGAKHALRQGLHRHAKAGREATPLFDGICMACHDETKPIKFVAITKSGKVSNQPEAINTYLCVDCISKIGGPGI